MFKNKLYTFILAILLIVLVIFLRPVKKQSFSDLCEGDQAVKTSLIQFRELPLKNLSFKDQDWEYIKVGNGAQNLLFLHGMGGAYDIWFQQIEALKDSFTILSLTLPTVNSLSDATDGIVNLLNHENIEKVSIIGTSMGGYISQYFLKKQPDRLEKLVLGNTFPPNELFQKQNGGMRKMVPFLPEWFVMSKFKSNASANVVPASENSKLVEAYLHEQYSGLMSKKQFIGRFDIVLESFDPNIKNMERSVPKLIIESDNDPLVPAVLRQKLKALYPDAQVYTFDNKGHFPYLNDPSSYTNVIKAFLFSPQNELKN